MSMRSLTAPLLALLFAASALEAQTFLRSHDGSSNGERSGAALASGKDFNGDGVEDLVVGSPGHSTLGADQGRVRVFSGASGALILTVAGPMAGSLFGSALALSTDINGDALADVIVGAHGHDGGLGGLQGQVQVIGALGVVVHTLLGSSAGDRFGEAVASMGDTNSDGRSEFAVGAPGFDGPAGADAGRITIYDGLSGAALVTIDGSAAGEGLGSALGNGADLHSTLGFEFVIGSKGFDGVAGADCGRVAVHSAVNGSLIWSVEGALAGHGLGASVALAGDTNLDTTADVVAGSPEWDGGAGLDQGRVDIFSGNSGLSLASILGSAAGDRAGASVAGGVDLDGDGYSDVAFGSPGFDGGLGVDQGRTTAYRSGAASTLFTIDGALPADAGGSAVALFRDPSTTSRGLLATSSPLADLSGSDRGQTRLFQTSPSTSVTASSRTAAQPFALTSADADSDGDRDLITLTPDRVSIHWNGTNASGVSVGSFAILARTELLLTPGSTSACLLAAQLDSDSAPEFVIGRNDGTVDVLDGTGSGAGASFSLTPASPFAIDTSPGPGPVADLAVRGVGASATLYAALAGTIVNPGSIVPASNLLGSPSLGATLVSGGSFVRVLVDDLNGDGNADVIAANTGGASTGVHVHLGPSLTAAVGSPFSAGVSPQDLQVLDLDGDSIRDDVAIASLGFVSGGARILPDFVAGSGFSATVNLGLSLARGVASGNWDATAGDDLAVLDGSGSLIRYQGWNGAAFAATFPTPTTSAPAFSVTAAQFTAGGGSLCNTDEIATIHFANDVLVVWRNRRNPVITQIAGTGCPIGASVATLSLSGEATIGSTSIVIRLAGASPFSMAFVVAAPNTPVGSTPGTGSTSGCGFVLFPASASQYFAFTDATGNAAVPAGLPLDPCLIGQEFALQWGILDGGPILSALSVSNALLVRLGEP